jgi:uncharacterized membrane protein
VTNRNDDSQRRQGRQAFFVIIATVIAWVAINLAGGPLGIPARFVFLADFAALAAFLWALIVLIRLWRARGD